MPVYEYRCRACGEDAEIIHPMDAAPPEACERCGGELRRVYGRVGVRFSGWGFRRTDRLVPEDRPKKDFGRLQRKAEEITDS